MKEIDWKILTVLYEKKSMTKAADALFMTQSALTKRVRAIEEEWDIEIVKRSSQGVLFTGDGRYLMNKAHIMLDFLKEIENHFAENKTMKELLKIGVPNSFARLHMPHLLGEYVTGEDKIQVKTVPNSSDVIIRQLTDGSIDIGILCGDYPYLGEKVCLFHEEMYMIAPKGMRMEDIGDLPLIVSNFNSLVKLMVDQWWKLHFGIIPQEAYRVPYADIAIEMVESGLGVTFVFGSRWKVNEEKLQKMPVYDRKGDAVSRNVWMMISDPCFRNQDIMDFIRFVEKYYQVDRQGP